MYEMKNIHSLIFLAHLILRTGSWGQLEPINEKYANDDNNNKKGSWLSLDVT